MYCRKLPRCGWSVVGPNMNWKKMQGFPSPPSQPGIGKDRCLQSRHWKRYAEALGLRLTVFGRRGQWVFLDASAERDVGSLVGPESKTAGTCDRTAQKYGCGQFCNLILSCDCTVLLAG